MVALGFFLIIQAWLNVSAMVFLASAVKDSMDERNRRQVTRLIVLNSMLIPLAVFVFTRLHLETR